MVTYGITVCPSTQQVASNCNHIRVKCSGMVQYIHVDWGHCGNQLTCLLDIHMDGIGQSKASPDAI